MWYYRFYNSFKPNLSSRVLERRALSAGALVGAALYKLSWSTTRSGAPKKAGALVGAQLALQRSDSPIIHAKNEKYLALRANSVQIERPNIFSSIASVARV